MFLSRQGFGSRSLLKMQINDRSGTKMSVTAKMFLQKSITEQYILKLFFFEIPHSNAFFGMVTTSHDQ